MFIIGGCPPLCVLFVFSDDARNLVGGKTTVNLVTNHGNGSKTASSDATEGVQRELAIGCAFANLNVEFACESVQYFLSTTYVAGGTEAYIDRMLTLRLHGKEAVERNDAVDA